MRINVAGIKLEAGAHKQVDLSVMPQSAEMGGQPVRFEQPFTGVAEIWNAGDRLLVEVELSGEAVLQCSRCLTEYTDPIDLSYEEEFMEGEPGDEVDEESEDLNARALSFYTGDEIDLSDSLQESILLALPMKPLCDEDCKGLCTTCGANLNEGLCHCGETHDVDPRLSALKELLRRPDSNS